MSAVLTVVVWLLIPAGLLPIVTAWVLRKYRGQPSRALRDRWHLSLVLAALGGIVSVLSLNRLLDWGVEGATLVLPFALVLLAVDILSGRWLLDHWHGRFELPDPSTPKEILEKARLDAARLVEEVAEQTARRLVLQAELDRVSRTADAAERTAEDQKRSADASERTAAAAERTAENTKPNGET